MPKITYETKKFSPDTLSTITTAEGIIREYQAQGFSLTLRQLYYQFVARGLIANTERDYKRIGNIVSDARRAGLIDWEAIEDRTRFLRRLSAWNHPKDILESARDSYRRDLWETQGLRYEVWIEKDALVGVIEPICKELHVPFFSCRGYVSDSEMWSAGIRVQGHNRAGQNVIILHLGDHDPSGIDMTRDIRTRIELFSELGDFELKRIALTMEQIEEQSPPPNPAKVTDSRYESYASEYGDESWELDALEPRFISDLIQNAVFEERDIGLWQEAVDEMDTERNQIQDIIDRWDELF
ncbi:MAG: hypothetical protein E3J60_01240 [Dehalococcoidia bacterium]|nr:MAG: hypothetical protein E3J60_01240 [Dehalococcoidia bacterium]